MSATRHASKPVTTQSTSPAGRPSVGWIVLGLVILTLGLVGLESVVALAVFVLESACALVVLAAAALAGGWLVSLLGLGRASRAERVVLGACLGVGSLSLLVFGLAAVGAMSRGLAFVLVGLVAAAACARLRHERSRSAKPEQTCSCSGDEQQPVASVGSSVESIHSSTWRGLWLSAIPFLAIACLAATLPPGILWQEEGFGYDVLEYHLAVPKAYLEQGQVSFMPNNVYASFPLNAEMLWLLMMALGGDAIDAVFMVQGVNVGLALLTVAAAWLVGLTWSPRAGVAAGVLVATCPWLTYLAGIAFVEPGMLAMGMAALAALLRTGQTNRRAVGYAGAGGLLAGLACGFKYTAVPLIAAPLALVLLLAGPASWARLRALAIYGAACLLAFAPWLVRNLVDTGNPVFPLAYSVFGARPGLWDDALQSRWERAHASAEAERTERPWIGRVFDRTLGDLRTGPLLWALAVVGAVGRRDRRTWALIAMAACQLAVWGAATHLFARFAVVLLLPLVALAAGGIHRPWLASRGSLLCGLLVLAAAANLYHIGTLYYHHTRVGPAKTPITAYGQVGWLVEGQWPGMQHVGWVNALQGRANVLLIGEARSYYFRRPCEYAVVFNHHPLGEAARQIADDHELMDWLRDRGTTHLLFHWDELTRLRRTYGLPRGLDDRLLPRLEAAGLKAVASVSSGDGQPPYATLFEVPADE